MSAPRKRMIIEAATREVILKVHTYFETERDQCKELLKRLNSLTQGVNTVTVPLKLFMDVANYLKCTAQVSKRTTAATQVNKNTLTKIKEEGLIAKANNTNLSTPVRRPRGKKKYFSKTDYDKLKDIIRENFIHKSTDNNNMKLKSILCIAQQHFNYLGSMATLRRIMWGMGFRWERRPGTLQVNLVEKAELSKSILITCDKDIELEKYCIEDKIMEDAQLELLDVENIELEGHTNHQNIPSTEDIAILDTDNYRLVQLNTESTDQERPTIDNIFVEGTEHLDNIEDFGSDIFYVLLSGHPNTTE